MNGPICTLLLSAVLVIGCAASPAAPPAASPAATVGTAAVSSPSAIPTPSHAAPATTLPTTAPSPRSGATVKACGPEDELTVPPIALDKITSITPLGALDAPGHVFPTDHVYVNVPGRDRQHEIVPVVSPGALSVWRITSQVRTGELSFSDYKLEFALCGGRRAHFAHMGAVSERLQTAFDGARQDCRERQIPGGAVRTCAAEVTVPLAPSEPIGRTNPTATGLDFGAFDPMRVLPFVSPERYRTNLNTRGALCPLDLFSPTVRMALAARLGASDGSGFRARTSEPVCGEVAQDRSGTAQGNWFRAGLPAYPEDTHLSFVHDNVDPALPRLAVGLSLTGLAPGIYAYGQPSAAGTVNPRPSQVTPGSVRCLDGLRARQSVRGRVLLSLTENALGLDIEYDPSASCGSGPWTLSRPIRFER